MHRPNHDLRPFHMGFSIVGSNAKLKIITSDDFLLQDSLMAMRTRGFPGFAIGGISNLRLGEYFDLRALPQLHFTQRDIFFHFNDRIDKVTVESVSFDLPVLLKYKSKRRANYRVYTIAGVRFTHDFASNEDATRGPFRKMVVLKKRSISYEFGVGMDLYTQMFKFSPEIKMTNSIGNVHSSDPYMYNNSIKRIQTRLFQISLHFE
jgi:hypothetical protein